MKKIWGNLDVRVKIGVIGVIFFLALILSMNLFENLDADKLMVIQSPISGNLRFYISAGIKYQGFGKVTKYIKLDTYNFKIPVRFNEGGHGTIIGSINYSLPFDNEKIRELHTMFGSQEAIVKELIETVINKCIYMTGPLMSSKESYAEKRTSLIYYIEDQITNGVYKTTQKDIKTKDPITDVEKTVTVVELVMVGGKPARQEEAVLNSYGIKTSNFAVTGLPYDDTVEAQIKQQQEINMKVQTAIASAKEAEQNAITVAKQGEANAAKSKWEQEVIKAKLVVEAQQRLEVATLDRKSAEQKKIEQILLGEGEAERRRLVMNADGALTLKLDTYKEVMKIWAENMSKQKWVSEISFGGDSKSNSAIDLLNIMGIKAAKDLSLEMNVK